MPIAGLTDRRTGGMPIIGKLFKGGPKREKTRQDGSKYEIFGEELDHFRFVPKIVTGTGEGKEVSDFREIYGVNPRHLSVYLPYADVDANFPTWWEIYKGGRLMYRGDGTVATLWYDEKSKQYQHTPVPFPAKEVDGKKVAQMSGTLHLMLPHMWERGHIGIVTLTTHSTHDILRIHGALTAYQRMRGSLAGILFTLLRYQDDVVDPEGKSREKWLVGIKPDSVWAVAQLAATRQEAYAELPAMAGSSLGAIDDGIIEGDQEYIDEDTGEIITVTTVESKASTTPAPQKAAPPPAKPAKGKTVPTPVVEHASMKAMLNRLHQLGAWLYSKQWDTSRGIIVHHVSGGSKTSSKDLTAIELKAAVDILEERWKAVTSTDATICIGQMVKHVRKINEVGPNAERLAAWINKSVFKPGSDPKALIAYLISANRETLDEETLQTAIEALYSGPAQGGDEDVQF